MFPKFKKNISGFLLSEEGKISKQSMLALGSFVSAAIIGGSLASKQASATHANNLTVEYQSLSRVAVGTHAHHSSEVYVSPSACDCAGACSGSGE
ncbi:MAG: hypothetical protein V1837_08160 [Candidatus Woesearchaeota archaeon]